MNAYLERNVGSNAQLGKIYIHKHKSGKLVKVGETSKSSTGRLKSYSRDWDLSNFYFAVEFLVPMEARLEIESRVKKLLKKHKICGTRGGPQEIFACDLGKAKWAVQKAISENQKVQEARINKRAREAHQRALDNTRTIAVEQHQKSPWVVAKKRELADFINVNTFEKERTRSPSEVGDIIFEGLSTTGLGALFVWGSSYLGSGGGVLLFLLGLFLGYEGVKKIYQLGSPPTKIPDDDAISKRKALEAELRNAERKVCEQAEADFNKSHSVSDFKPDPNSGELTYQYFREFNQDEQSV